MQRQTNDPSPASIPCPTSCLHTAWTEPKGHHLKPPEYIPGGFYLPVVLILASYVHKNVHRIS